MESESQSDGGRRSVYKESEGIMPDDSGNCAMKVLRMRDHVGIIRKINRSIEPGRNELH